MSREHIDFARAEELENEPVASGPLAGARGRLLSLDDDTRAATELVSLPDGFTCNLEALEGSLELLVVDGAIELGGRTLGPLGWARAGRAGKLGWLTASRESKLLWMTDAATSEAPTVLDGKSLPWRAGSHGGPAGIAIKLLADAGPVSMIVANVPRYDSGPEFHECPEELFVVSGDVTGQAGTMTSGSYFWRPEYVTHGPYHSESGLLCFLRGHGELHAHWIDDANASIDENRAYAATLRRAPAT
jgi:hypothetical protein